MSDVSSDPNPQGGLPVPNRDRRRQPRRPLQAPGTLEVVDGPSAGSRHDITTRDLSLSGISFLLKEPLAVGQLCRVTYPGSQPQLCEITRSRPLSNGKHEMAAQFR
jgi:hypothetical protein